jgi:hypothetical protein
MTNSENSVISVVAYQEGPVWIAQGLEYDISAQANSLPAVRNEFMRVLFSNLAVCVELDLEPLEGIDSAPQEFWEMFKQAGTTLEPEAIPIRTPRPVVRPHVKMKVGELQAA